MEPTRNGIYVMTVNAIDYDDPSTENAQLEYRITVNKELNQQPIFRIDPENGKIYLMTRLDRDIISQKEFIIEVRANDKGQPQHESAVNVTIRLLDVNNHPPYFDKDVYYVSVAENEPLDSPILTLLAKDPDDEASDNIFSYSLVDDPNEFFYITTESSTSGNIGVLRIKKVCLSLAYALNLHRVTFAKLTL
jgi:hypothetical protein